MGLELTPSHGWVGLTVAASALIHNGYMAWGVIKARKKYKVNYPDLYAPADHPNKKEFDCVQRGMQNSLELLPSFLSLLVVAGARFPVSASAVGGIYLLGRILYFNGYATGEPKKRYRGGFGTYMLMVLVGMVGRWSYELLQK